MIKVIKGDTRSLVYISFWGLELSVCNVASTIALSQQNEALSQARDFLHRPPKMWDLYQGTVILNHPKKDVDGSDSYSTSDLGILFGELCKVYAK